MRYIYSQIGNFKSINARPAIPVRYLHMALSYWLYCYYRARSLWSSLSSALSLFVRDAISIRLLSDFVDRARTLYDRFLFFRLQQLVQ